MRRYIGISVFSVCSLLLTTQAFAVPNDTRSELSVPNLGEDYLVGDVEGTGRVSGKVLADTTWVADWTFDVGGSCSGIARNDSTAVDCANGSVWCARDNRIVSDGVHYWIVTDAYNGLGTIQPFVGKTAALTKHDLCWEIPDGYANGWDQSIILTYQSGNSISVRYVVDTEVGFDFFYIETDSLGLSEERVDYDTNPQGTPDEYRTVIHGPQSGQLNAEPISVSGLPLTPNGPGTHEVYLRFWADGGYSDEDGFHDTAIDAPVVIDDIVITGVGGYSENFEGALHANITFANTAPEEPFGLWARLFKGITDNDFCTENPTCAWLFTDNTTPTVGSGDNAYGPSGYVIRNWIDNTITSPWVNLAGTLDAKATFLTFRIFGGNNFDQSKIAMNWSIRTKVRIDNTDTTGDLTDSLDCISPWGHQSSWGTIGFYFWGTVIADATPEFDSRGTEVQVRLRVSDWQYVAGDPPPVPQAVGPGPYFDRVRLGRNVLNGPVLTEGIDARTQAQDCFGASVDGTITPGQHHAPSQTATSRFEGVHMSRGQDLGVNNPGSPRVITGDSISIQVQDIRLAGGISRVEFFGAIVEGPHAGKVPPGFVSGPGGFFKVAADSIRVGSPPLGPNILADLYFIDLGQEDPGYLRGGDRLVYFWLAEDAGGAVATDPKGLSADPISIAQAEEATGGLLEMSALPAIDWDPAYLTAIGALAPGANDPGPSAQQITNSTQKNCILYVQQLTSRRRSGDLNRTNFMYTLDKLGYKGKYDVYDVTGYGNTNNQLFSRATINQLGGYELIVHDTGRSRTLTMTDGTSNDNEKINMQLNYQNWLSTAPTLHGVARATLWGVGENLVEGGHPTNVTFWGNALGVNLASNDQGDPVPASSPDVVGKATNAWAAGGSTDWTDGGVVGEAALFTLDGGCPVARDYDGLGSSGSVLTHVYRVNDVEGDGAISIYNRGDGAGNAIVSSFGFFDIRPHVDTTVGTADPSADLVSSVLAGVLSEGCREEPNTQTGLPPGHELDVPRVTVLKQNVPNPFNPSTTIHFDLARSGQVRLRVFDVAGHLVRTLVDEKMEAGRGYRATWNGLDHAGGRVSSGVYFYQLEATDFMATKKMVVLK